MTYAKTLRRAVEPGGWVIIAGFAPGGPERCSGLDIVQHDADSIGSLLGAEFTLMKSVDEAHSTPTGAEQAFRYFLCRRAAKSEEDARDRP